MIWDGWLAFLVGVALWAYWALMMQRARKGHDFLGVLTYGVLVLATTITLAAGGVITALHSEVRIEIVDQVEERGA